LSYQVIARKWRSQSFSQLVGQDHVTTTLQNALKNNRLPHALLFTGPRGTGKTSSARILAKALRCPNAKDFVPCNVCRECEEISLSRSPNVLEIDGASNNGVDAIRELRDTVIYAPSSGKYKVYIIDEVHMLSTSAFNALLKTLEEPPEHVVFIMATTEVQKIPQTILSRCQRFDFRRIATRLIADHLKLICEKEGIPADGEALWIVARQGDGSMRDAQSLLDQVVTFANGALTRTNVVEILGLTDRSLLLETLSALVLRDSQAILQLLQKLSIAGFEPSLFANDLLENIRHLLLTKISTEENQLVELPDSEIRVLQDLSHHCTEEDLHLLFDMMMKGANDIHRSSDPRVLLEMVLLRMAAAPRIVDLRAFLTNGAGAVTAPKASLTTSITTSAPKKSGVPASASTPPPVAAKPAAPKVTPRSASMHMSPQEKWFELVQMIKSVDSLLGAKIEQLLVVAEKGKTIELAVPAKMAFLKEQITDRVTREKLQGFVDQHWGAGYSLNIGVSQDSNNTGTSAKSLEQEKETKKQQNMAEQVAAHPSVRAANTAFKGQIKSIKENT
jgi:DNA polymerase-3 subunit gamma/tau